jgi:ribosomal-protein-alanine N-acetyltransferase
MNAIIKPETPLFRRMTDADIEEVMAIEVQAYTHPWTAGIFHDCLRVGYYCQVAVLEGKIAGYGILSLGAGEAHILNLCVRAEMQGQGLGRAMLDHLLEAARRLHAEMVLLEVRPSNRAAVHLYQSVGFNEVGVRNGYYLNHDGREDALILALPL